MASLGSRMATRDKNRRKPASRAAPAQKKAAAALGYQSANTTKLAPPKRRKHTQNDIWNDKARERHWQREDRKDKAWGVVGVTLLAAYLGAAWYIDSKLPKEPEQPAGTVVYRTPAGDPLTAREQRQKQALVKFAQSRADAVQPLHEDMAANARAGGLTEILERLEPYLGSSYGLPRAKETVAKLLEVEADTDAPIEQRLESILAVYDALERLAGANHGEASRYHNDYFRKSDLTRFMFNYRFPDRTFHEDLVEPLRKYIKTYDERIIRVDPRIQMSGTFGPGWQPLRPY